MEQKASKNRGTSLPKYLFSYIRIKYYNNIRANFLSYFNVNVYFIT